VKRTRPRKPTDQLIQTTARKRSKEAAVMKTAVSDGAKGIQPKDELEAMGKTEERPHWRSAWVRSLKLQFPREMSSL